MEPKNKFWLISDNDVQSLQQSIADDALHTLESGLHLTDAIPSDYGRSPSDQALHDARWLMAELRWRLDGLLNRPVSRSAETEMIEMMIGQLDDEMKDVAELYQFDDHSAEWPYPLG